MTFYLNLFPSLTDIQWAEEYLEPRRASPVKSGRVDSRADARSWQQDLRKNPFSERDYFISGFDTGQENGFFGSECVSPVYDREVSCLKTPTQS